MMSYTFLPMLFSLWTSLLCPFITLIFAEKYLCVGLIALGAVDLHAGGVRVYRWVLAGDGPYPFST